MKRPKLRDDTTVINPHSKRWNDLIAYVRQLNAKFPTEDLLRLCGFFSTEREFKKHILTIEKRLKAKR